MSKDQEPQYQRKEPAYTPEDLTDWIGRSLQTLLTDLEQHDPTRLKHYLAFAGRFHQYSTRNRLLIFEQRPDATRVASYQKWKQEGYQVAKGEKGIRILVPRFPKGYRKRIEEDPDQTEEEGTDHQRRQREVFFVTHNFTVGSIFDVSQLTPDKRPPAFFVAIEGNYEATYHRMKQAAEAEGIRVVESYQCLEGARGISAGGLIVIRPDLSPGSKAAVLAHEWGHEKIHTPELRRLLPKTTKEGHAEAVAYVVASHFGIPTPDTADYLTLWGNKPDTLRRELTVVTAAASAIIKQIHSLEPGEQHFHDQEEAGEVQQSALPPSSLFYLIAFLTDIADPARRLVTQRCYWATLIER